MRSVLRSSPPRPARPVARLLLAPACVLALLVLLALGGCGGGSSDHGQAERQVTFPAYGSFPATTVAVTQGSPALCKRDAESIARDAVAFLRPSPTPADMYYVTARTHYVDFRAHDCNPDVLRHSLERRLSPAQIRALVARMVFLPESLG